MYNCVFDNNTASNFGGAVVGGDQAETSLNNCVLKNNYAAIGGAFILSNSAKLHLTNCILTNKTAQVHISLFWGLILSSTVLLWISLSLVKELLMQPDLMEMLPSMMVVLFECELQQLFQQPMIVNLSTILQKEEEQLHVIRLLFFSWLFDSWNFWNWNKSIGYSSYGWQSSDFGWSSVHHTD